MRYLHTLSILKAILLLFFTQLFSCSPEESNNKVQQQIDLTIANQTNLAMADPVLAAVNTYRSSKGMSTLKFDTEYATAYAVEHTLYMIALEQINHDNFINRRSKGLKQKGAVTVGENVAFGYTDPRTLIRAFSNSPGHKKILEGNYTHLGIGVVDDTNGRFYFTLLFYKRQ